MSKITNGGLDQYGAGPFEFEQQQFGTGDVEGAKQQTSETLGQLAELIEHVQYIGCYVLANIYHRRKLAHEFYDSLIRSVS